MAVIDIFGCVEVQHVKAASCNFGKWETVWRFDKMKRGTGARKRATHTVTA
jgi:hypothetical protein